MITREDLSGSFHETEASALYERARQEGDLVAFCRRFMHDTDHRVVRNALWALTKAKGREPRQLQPALTDLTGLAMTTTDSAVRRLALTLSMRLPITEADLRSDFLDFCLEHMTDMAEPPGVQSCCMRLAHAMCAFHPELREELRRTLETMEPEYYKPAVRSIRKKILDSRT